MESVGFTAITGPANMGLPESMAIDRLEGDPDYKREFERIFGKGGVLGMARLFGLYPFLLRLYADGG